MEDERVYIEKLMQVHRQRLHKLEERKAMKGIDTAPEDLIEIDNITTELKHLEERQHWARATRIDLCTHVELAPLDSTTIQLNWTACFHNGVADQDTWATTLLLELHQTYQRVARSSAEPAVALRQRANHGGRRGIRGHVFRCCRYPGLARAAHSGPGNRLVAGAGGVAVDYRSVAER